jgi:uncharacterized protein YaaR (DUF327 family)
LQLLSQEVEEQGNRMLNDKEAETVTRGRREAVKEAFKECRDRTVALNQRSVLQAETLRECV